VTDQHHLQAELFAARQELARRRIEDATTIHNYTDRLAYLPERPVEFSRLAGLDAETLAGHIARLKRDLDSLQEPGPDRAASG
jgi:hypothetical protein